MSYTEKDFQLWKKYEIVRRSGEYNMMTQFEQASKEAKLSISDYTNILKRYSFIKSAIEEKYGNVEAFLES